MVTSYCTREIIRGSGLSTTVGSFTHKLAAITRFSTNSTTAKVFYLESFPAYGNHSYMYTTYTKDSADCDCSVSKLALCMMSNFLAVIL